LNSRIYSEKAGTGTLDMITRCRAAGLAAPEFHQDGLTFIQTLRRLIPPETVQVTAPVTVQVTGQVTEQDKKLSDSVLRELCATLGASTMQVTMQVAMQVTKLLMGASVSATRSQLQKEWGLKNRDHFRKTYLEPLVTSGWLERTIPGKPNSRLQKYRLTEKGRAWLGKTNQ